MPSLTHRIQTQQTVEVIDPAKRDDRLLQLLSKHHSSRKNRIIIFVLYKKEAPRVEGLLKRKGWNAGAARGFVVCTVQGDAGRCMPLLAGCLV